MCLSSLRFPSSSLSCRDRGVQSRIGGERGWPRGTLFWLLVVRLMPHQGCNGAGWQCWSLLPTSQVHSGPVSLLLPGVPFCELPVKAQLGARAAGSPTLPPAWKVGAGLPEGGRACLGSRCWPWRLFSAACSAPARPRSTVAVSWPECCRILAWMDSGDTAWRTVRTVLPSSLFLPQGLWPWEPLSSFVKRASHELRGREHLALG